LAKGTLLYRGKYFLVYQLNKKYYVYKKNYASPISSHIKATTAINRAKSLNKKAANLPWWDRD